MSECPKCKGTTGYTYCITVIYNQECDWDGNPIEADSTSGSEGKIYECTDCGTRFRKSTIEKLEQGLMSAADLASRLGHLRPSCLPSKEERER